MKLTNEEKQFIITRAEIVTDVCDFLDLVKTCADKFKVGDYVIAYWPAQTIDDGYGEYAPPELIKNSYGLALKYQVVYVDENKIPYIKTLNKNNKPYGPLECPIKISGHVDECRIRYTIEIDPDYTDAILLEDEANFNATQTLKAKVALRQEIVEHNKKFKIKLDSPRDVQVLYSKVKPGDILWRSSKSSISVVEVVAVGSGNHPIRRLKILTNKNKEITYRTSQLVNMNLYTDQPRNFSELRDPK